MRAQAVSQQLHRRGDALQHAHLHKRQDGEAGRRQARGQMVSGRVWSSQSHSERATTSEGAKEAMQRRAGSPARPPTASPTCQCSSTPAHITFTPSTHPPTMLSISARRGSRPKQPPMIASVWASTAVMCVWNSASTWAASESAIIVGWDSWLEMKTVWLAMWVWNSASAWAANESAAHPLRS